MYITTLYDQVAIMTDLLQDSEIYVDLSARSTFLLHA